MISHKSSYCSYSVVDSFIINSIRYLIINDACHVVIIKGQHVKFRITGLDMNEPYTGVDGESECLIV